MRNPWLDLPIQQLFVLPEDRPHVEVFNADPRLLPKHRLELSLFPQPFVGNRLAPLVVLGRNPDLVGGHGSGPYAEALRRNLIETDATASHLALLPEFADGPNARWWRRSFKSVLAVTGASPGELAPRVLSVEFHGYHSEQWKLFPTLPSQHYGFWLVQQAVERGATVVLMRGVRDWKVAVPTLSGYPRLVTSSSWQSNSISPTNCPNGGFEMVLDALDR